MADDTEIQQRLRDYRRRLSSWRSSPNPTSAEALLIAREQIRRVLGDRQPLTFVDELAALDAQLLEVSPEVAAVLGTRLQVLSGIAGSEHAWWWKIEPSRSWIQFSLDALTVFGLALSLAILVDVFGRMFTGPSDPASLALQSLVGLAGGAAAWQLVKSAMVTSVARRRIRMWALPVMMLATAATLTMTPLSGWYLQRAIRQLEIDPDPGRHPQPDVALQLAERASRLSPSGLVYYHVAVAHEALGDATRAITAYQRAIAEAPTLYLS